jgi:hypothetical protein
MRVAKKFSVAQRAKAPKAEPAVVDRDIAVRFAKALDEEFGSFLHAAVLFGSCATGVAGKESDIDILIVIDDVRHVVDDEVTERYRGAVLKNQKRVSKRLHINTLKLTNLWEYCREGDPVIINMLRDGLPLIDKGFFTPAQLLLSQGRIRPTREAVWTYYARTSNTIRSSRQHLLSACVDLYWAAIDASHAALMSVGVMPPSPEHVPDLLERELVKKGMLEARYPPMMRELYALQKAIAHREVKEISGQQYDAYFKETLQLIEHLRTVVERMPLK